MTSSSALVLFAVLAASLGSGCSLPTTPAASSTTSSGTLSAPGRVETSVVEQLSAARCAQEASCHHVGAGATYASRSLCMEDMRGAVTRDVESYRCPRGIEEDVPGVCIHDVKSEECDHPFQSLNGYRSCRDDALCAR